MKQVISLLGALVLSAVAFDASARDDIQDYSIADAMASEQAKAILGSDVKYYFGDQEHPEVVKTINEYRTNRKTNGANKSDREACEWVFLSTMKSLHDKAKEVGGNAVVNIRSNYRNNTTSSATTFRCGSGTLISGVALIGDIVEIKE